ncbi:hypothetical protein [Alkalihalobacterium elongatum]|uniref:hypothetical protein n=1 Tax=Alkalihalobacterium elongatum TaxID=2675466 RepID=UPI001C1F3A7C|nr:hypothetical protein [Alkalihalobacterium elongatum]
MNYYDLWYRSTAAINIIEKLLTRESTSIITYDYLMVIAESEESKQMLRRIIQIRRKSDEQLKWVYFQITGQMVAVDQDVFEKPDTFVEGIKGKIERQQTRLTDLRRLLDELTLIGLRGVVENIIVEEDWVYSALNYLER